MPACLIVQNMVCGRWIRQLGTYSVSDSLSTSEASDNLWTINGVSHAMQCSLALMSELSE
jgi:hypothetical protein